MTALTFTITFRGPFAVSTGIPADGVDTTIDPGNPLPSSALKGLLKAQLRSLGASDTRLRGIFTTGDGAGWVFGDADVSITPGLWTRVKVDDDGRAEDRFLMLGQQAFASTGTFRVMWDGCGDPPPMHEVALRGAARMVTSLGSHRRRGLGWVSITDDREWTPDDTEHLLAWLTTQEA